MARRRLGWTGARELAAGPSLAVAVHGLAGSPYGRDMPAGASSGSVAELRAGLSASPWGDPGRDTVRDVQLGMRLAWVERVRSRVPSAARWALSGAALLVARERFAAGRPVPLAAGRLLGHGAVASAGLAEGIAIYGLIVAIILIGKA